LRFQSDIGKPPIRPDPAPQPPPNKGIEEMKKTGESGESSQIRKRIEEVDAKVHPADERLGKRMDQQDDVQHKIDDLGVRITEIECDIALLEEDMERIGEWSRSAGGSPMVKVAKTIYSNITIKRPTASSA